MSYKGQEASVKLPYGVYPVGGTVDGVCQLEHHKDKKNELPQGKAVTIVRDCIAAVKTWGELFNGHRVELVQVDGYQGWYMKNAFHLH